MFLMTHFGHETDSDDKKESLLPVLFRSLGHSLEQKRKYLAGRLQKIGFNILPAQGSYFLMADFRSAELALLMPIPGSELLCIKSCGCAGPSVLCVRQSVTQVSDLLP